MSRRLGGVVVVGFLVLAGRAAAQSATAGGAPTRAPVPTDNAPVFFPDGKRLAFETTRENGLPRIHVMNVDGSDEHPPTAAPGPQLQPAVSPDGTQIAFAEAGLPTGGMPRATLVVVNADGSGRRVIADLPLSLAPSWSPDAKRIAFAAAENAPAPKTRPDVAVWMMAADGSNKRKLFPDHPRAYEIHPSWAPDGKRLLYVTADSLGHSHLNVVDADGSNAHPLGAGLGVRGELPRWSPDGRTILFWSTRDGNADVYLVDAKGDHERRLTDSPARDETPAWSPDGKQIVFQSDRDGAMTLYIMNADGTNIRHVRP